MARLIFRADSGEKVELNIGPEHPEVFIGRQKTCEIHTVDSTVSRRHAQIRWESGGYHLIDLGSSNGTFYDQDRIGDRWLEDGDDFSCGAFPVRFVLDPSERGQTVDPVDASIAGYDDDDDDGVLIGVEVKDDELEVEVEPEPPPFVPPEAPPALPPPVVAVESSVRETKDTFSEFNRHLEAKERAIAELREQIKARDERLSIVTAENAGLADALEAARSGGGGTGEVSVLSATNAALESENASIKIQHQELQARLVSLQAQILRVQESQPSEKDLQRLRDAAAERDLLWEQRDALEGRILSLKRQLSGGDASPSDESDPESLAREVNDRLRNTQDDLADALERLRDAEERAREAEQHATSGDAALREAQGRTEQVQDEVARLENRIDELENRPSADALSDAYARVEAAESRTISLQVALDDARAAAEDHSVEAAQARASLTAESAALKLELAALKLERDALSRQALDKSALDGAQQKLTAATRDLESAQRLVDSLGRERDTLRAAVDDRARVGEEARKRALHAEAENVELKEMIATLPDRETVRSLERQRDEIARERDGAVADRLRFEAASASLDARVASADRELAASRERLATETKRFEAERAESRSRTVVLENKVRELEEVLVHTPSRGDVDDLRTRIANAERERDAAGARAEAADRRRRDLEAELDSARTGERTQRALAEESRSTATKFSTELSARVATLEAQLVAADRTKVAAEAARLAAEGQVARLESARASAETARTTAESALQDATRQLEAAKDTARLATDASHRAEEAGRAKDDLVKRAEDGQRRLEEAARATEAKASAAQQALLEQVRAVTQERDELMASNKASLRRISNLLKQVEEGGQSAKTNTDASARVATLERDLAASTARVATLEAELESLRPLRSGLDRATERATEAERALSDHRLLTQRKERELEARIQTLERQPAPVAPVATPSAGVAVEKFVKVIDELNDRLSALKNNDETIQFCLQDVRNGVDVADNYASASEMLEANGREFDGIKETLRRFRRDELRG